MCSSHSAGPGRPRKTESYVLTLSLFHAGKNTAFPWLRCWGFHCKKSLMCVLANLRELPNSQDCSHSLHTYCCMYLHIQCISQERANAYPKQASVSTSLARRHGPSYWAPEKASLPASIRISSPLAFSHYFFPQKVMTLYTCAVEIASLHELHLKEILQILQTMYLVSVVPKGKSCSWKEVLLSSLRPFCVKE